MVPAGAAAWRGRPVSDEWLQKVAGRLRLGPGVVGKSSAIGLGVLVVLGVAAWRIDNNPWLVVFIAIAGIAFAYWLIRRQFQYAEDHPETALLEGAELVAWRQMQMSTRDVPAIPPTAPQGPADA